MTYLDLIRDAEYKLEHNKITLGEYNKMIEPLRVEIPKVGRWIKIGEHAINPNLDICECSECNQRQLIQYKSRFDLKYCPNCGAKMEVNDEADCN